MRFEPFDLDDMRLFIRVAESNNMTHGAQRSYMTVPAASMRVKNIEQRIGAQLLRRRHGGVDLTPAGQTFLRYALLTVQNVDSLMSEMQDYASGAKGRLRVCANTLAMEFVPARLGAFLSAHPGVSIDLQQGASASIVRAVTDGSADIGIVIGDVPTRDLKVWPYKQDRAVMAVPVGHPLCDRAAIDFQETLDFDFIVLSEQSAMQAFLVDAAKGFHKPLKVRVQVADFDRMCQMVAAHIGIGMLPESAARRQEKNANIRYLPLNDRWATRHLQICVRDLAVLPSFAKDLIDMLVKDAAN
jgi:DNA-binding transcriptional LysR family regulator